MGLLAAEKPTPSSTALLEKMETGLFCFMSEWELSSEGAGEGVRGV